MLACTDFHDLITTDSGTLRDRDALRSNATSSEVLTNIKWVSYPS